MKFNVRSALAAVGQLAEGRLAGQVEAQQEQMQRDQAAFQRALSLNQLDQGANDDFTRLSLEAIRHGDPSAVGGPLSTLMQRQYDRMNPSQGVLNSLRPGAVPNLGLQNFSPATGDQPSAVYLPPLTNTPTDLNSPSGQSAPNTSSAPAPPPAVQPVAPPGPMQLGGNPFMMNPNPFSGAAEQAMRTMAPMIPFGLGNVMLQAMSPPPPPTAPPGVPPPGLTGPSGVGSAAAPAPAPAPGGVVPGAAPGGVGLAGQSVSPNPQSQIPPKPIKFPWGEELPVQGVSDKELGIIFNQMSRVAAEVEKLATTDNPNAPRIISILQHLPSYESGKTPEGRAAMQQVTNEMRALLPGAARTPTAGQTVSAERAKTAEETAEATQFGNALKRVALNAPEAVLRRLVKQYHQEGAYPPEMSAGDLRQSLLGHSIEQEMGTLRGLILHASNAPPGALADAVSRMNGLKGLSGRGAFILPFSEYQKLSPKDQQLMRNRAEVQIDRHIAAQDKHNMAPLEQQQAKLSIDLTKVRIEHLRTLPDPGRKNSLSASLRGISHQVDAAATDLHSFLGRKENTGVEADTREFVDSHFGDYLAGNSQTPPPAGWEKDPALDALTSKDSAILFIRKLLNLHHLRVNLDTKQQEIERELETGTGGTSQGSALHWPAGWNAGKANKVYQTLTGFGWTPDAARNEILAHPQQYGGP